MDNFTNFGWMGHLWTLMNSCDHQLSFEYQICDKNQVPHTVRHTLSIRTTFSHIDIAVMNYFVRMAHLGALMDFWDHQLSIEYKTDIVRYKSGTKSISIITAFSQIFLISLFKVYNKFDNKRHLVYN